MVGMEGEGKQRTILIAPNKKKKKNNSTNNIRVRIILLRIITFYNCRNVNPRGFISSGFHIILQYYKYESRGIL